MSTARCTGANPRSRVAVGLSLAVWVLSAGIARAQVFRTASEGLNVGHFVLYPSIAFEYTDDDNVFFASRELPGDQIIKSGVRIIRPRILMDLPLGANRVRWVYSPVYRDYTSKSFDQTRRISHFFDFEATHTGPVLTLRAGDHLVLGTVELQEVDRGGEAVFGTTPFRSYTTEGEVTLNVGARNGIALLPLYSAVTFDDSRSASFLGYNRRQVELRFQHAVSLPTLLYGFYSFDDTRQEREQVLFGNVSYEARTAGIGLRRSINQEVVTSLNAGYKVIDFTGGSRSNFTGPVVDANAVWQLGDATALAIAAGHQAYQSFYVNNNYYVDTELRLRLTHQVGHNVFWDSSIGFTNNHYADKLDISVTPETPSSQDLNADGRIDVYESLQPSVGRRRRDHVYHAEIGAGWQISRTLRLFIGYNSDRRRSNVDQVVSGQTIDPFDYSVNRVIFRLEAGWQ
jgi:Putative beta-barrel porin 2